jgi:hypothetical protein
LVRYVEPGEATEQAVSEQVFSLERVGCKCLSVVCLDRSGQGLYRIVSEHDPIMSVVSTESLLDEEVFSPSKSYRIEVFTWDEGGAWQSCCKDALDRQNMVRRLGRFAAPARAEMLYSDLDVYPDELWGKVDDTSASGTIGQW